MKEKDPAKIDEDTLWSLVTSACWPDLEKQNDVMATDIMRIVGKSITEKVLPLFDKIVVDKRVVGTWQTIVLKVLHKKVKDAFIACLKKRGIKGAYMDKTASECALLKAQENDGLAQKEWAKARKAREDAREQRVEASLERGRDRWSEKAYEHETNAYNLDQEARACEDKAESYRKIDQSFKNLSTFLEDVNEQLLESILKEWLEIGKGQDIFPSW